MPLSPPVGGEFNRLKMSGEGKPFESLFVIPILPLSGQTAEESGFVWPAFVPPA
jgi:hypothetical protein